MIVILSGQKDKGIFKIGIHIRLIFIEGSWLIEIAFIENPSMGFYTYMQKAGDSWDISPQFFWIFRKILG